MKGNAIVRIVIWSIAILVLAGILLAGLGIGGFFLATNQAAHEESMSVNPVTDPILGTVSGTVTDNVNVRRMPSKDAEAAGMLEPGDAVTITKTETVDGIVWGLLGDPHSGWIMMDYVQLDTSTSEKAANGGFGVPADEVHSISINWYAGNIVIEAADVEHIEFRETGDSKYSMVWTQRNGKLEFDFCEDDIFHGLGLNFGLDKDLYIQVPRDWTCGELELDAGSASLEVRDLTIWEVDIDAGSGQCSFQNCEVDAMDIDTASGDVEFTGTLNTLECDAASASFKGALSNVPSRMDMDTASGDIDLTLPEGAGFSVKLDAMSSDFSSDFQTTMQNGRYVHGDGYCRIDVSAMSGDVTIRKGAAASDTPTVPETTAP